MRGWLQIAARARLSARLTWTIAAATGLVWAVRVFVHLDKVIGPNGITPAGDADVYYHLRRILLATQLWPRVPDFDAWMSFPQGGYGSWPPLFDALPATFAVLTGSDAMHVALFWPPLLGAATAIPLLALANRLYGLGAAAGAGLLLALIPAHVAIACIGRVDHHVAEILLQVWLYAWLLRHLCLLEADGRLRVRASVGYGALMGVAMLTWSGAMLFLVVPAAIVALWTLPPRAAASADAAARHLAIAYGVAACVALPYGLLNASYGRAPLGFFYVSLLQPLLCVTLAAGLLGKRWILSPLFAGDARRAAVRALVLIACALVPLLLPGLRASLLGGFAYVGGSDGGFTAEVSEATPLLATAFTREFARQHVGYGYVLMPLLALLLAVRVLRAEDRTAARLLLLVWTVHVTLLALMQSRFLYYLVPVLALCPFVFGHELRRHGRFASVLAQVLALASLLPAIAYYFGPLVRQGSSEQVPLEQIDPQRLAFLTALRRVTPPAGNSNDPGRRPAYCVFAAWGLGHQLLVLGERPVVANNFGPYMEGGSYADQRRMYDAITDEQQAVALLERRACRYLITTASAGGSAAQSTLQPLFVRRLQLGDGSDRALGPGAGRLRLVHASPRGDYKLFELVPGALLDFGTVPEHELRIESASRVSAHAVEYQRAVLRDAQSGHAQVRVSYPGTYRVLRGQLDLGQIEVSDEAVRAGRKLILGSHGP